MRSPQTKSLRRPQIQTQIRHALHLARRLFPALKTRSFRFSLDTFGQPIIDRAGLITNTQRRQTQSIGSKQTRLRRCAGYITGFPRNLQMRALSAATCKMVSALYAQFHVIQRSTAFQAVAFHSQPGRLCCLGSNTTIEECNRSMMIELWRQGSLNRI